MPFRLLSALCAALLAFPAVAQLKLPSGNAPSAPGSLTAPAGSPPAATPASTSTASPPLASTPAPSPAASPAAPAAPASAMPLDPTKDPATLAKEAAGREAADAFLRLLDAGAYEKAWEGASGLFKSRVTKANWMQGIPAARQALGKVQVRQPAASQFKTQLAGAPDGEYVTTAFVGRYADRPQLEEIVTVVRESDGVWRMTGFVSR